MPQQNVQPMMGNKSLLERLAGQPVLSRISLGDVLSSQAPRHGVVKLRFNDSIGDALQSLSANRILAAPVMVVHDKSMDSSNEEGANNEETMIGWADVRWILRSFVVTHAAKLALVPDVGSWDSALDAVATDFLSRKLVNVCGDDGQLMPAAASEDMSLFSAIVDGFLSVGTGGEERTLTPRSGGSPRGSGGSEVVHRVALFRQGKVTSILSQSDCMTFLFRHPDLLGAQLWGAKVSELGFLGRRTVCVEPHTPAHAAFAVMFGHGVSGVGVVGANEELIANLSASDLRTLTNFRVLALPVLEFLDRAAEGQGIRRGLPVAVTPDTPFSSVLQMLGGEGRRVHRVYITHNGKPVGVITATDVLKLLVRLEEGDLTELVGPPA